MRSVDSSPQVFVRPSGADGSLGDSDASLAELNQSVQEGVRAQLRGLLGQPVSPTPVADRDLLETRQPSADLPQRVAQLEQALGRVQPAVRKDPYRRTPPGRGREDAYEPPASPPLYLSGKPPVAATLKGAPLKLFSQALGANPSQVARQLERGKYPTELAADEGLSPQEMKQRVAETVQGRFPDASRAMVAAISRAVIGGAVPPPALPSQFRGRSANPNTAAGALRLGIPRMVRA